MMYEGVVNDTYLLKWMAENSAAIRKRTCGDNNKYFVIYRNRITSGESEDFREAIRIAIKEQECTNKNNVEDKEILDTKRSNKEYYKSVIEEDDRCIRIIEDSIIMRKQKLLNSQSIIERLFFGTDNLFKKDPTLITINELLDVNLLRLENHIISFIEKELCYDTLHTMKVEATSKESVERYREWLTRILQVREDI